MLTGNKGEWSEIYTLLKLLGDGILYPGNEKIERISNVLYPIVKILRSEKNGDFEYSIDDNLIFISGNNQKLKIPVVRFKEQAQSLLNSIKSSSSRTFDIPEIEEFLSEINCTSLKASSSTKTDITIVVHDKITNQTPTLGFSIKSQLGNPSTILNAGKTTNFIYKIKGLSLSNEEVRLINAIATRSKIKDRILEVKKNGGKFNFEKTEKQIFSNNLVLIDSLLPQILSHLVLEFYTSNNTTTIDLLKVIEQQNPLNFNTSNNHQFYTYKIKRFLTDIALGMMPSKVWSGRYDATGGYLIVKESGDVLCYHIYNRNEFEDYLINNTKLDTASSSRHEFGKLYQENDQFYFKLNLQIRFIK